MNADLIHQTAMEYALDKSQETLDKAITAALPLSYAIASRFSGRGIETEDLRQVAAMALVSALNNFDPERGLRFTTYVTPTITGTVRNHIRDRAQILRTPRGLREQGMQLDRAYDALSQDLHREPTVMELADKLGWDSDRVLSVQSMRDKAQVASLDAPDDAGLMLQDKIKDGSDAYDAFESREDLRRALHTLSATERRVLVLRFQGQLSQQETAKRLGMTQMQVSRMERRVLKTMRQKMLAD
ncbi:MAG TPA: sigma-70 family RNA polymerase sigma factor [Clostridiales bacterium]|jgi:RNA polymerase sigma factor (sigma-70 family)|nr:sigma-70 family RNA polymerase sigma factor [Clostridiales bacterium]